MQDFNMALHDFCMQPKWSPRGPYAVLLILSCCMSHQHKRLYQAAECVQGVFGPAGGKQLIAFIDDLNMPQKSKFGFIPPLELLKLWVDYGFW